MISEVFPPTYAYLESVARDCSGKPVQYFYDNYGGVLGAYAHAELHRMKSHLRNHGCMHAAGLVAAIIHGRSQPDA
jgi:hypothetical protein